MAYFEEDTQLRDILITGGDALMSQNKTLKHILEAVLQMAKNKQKANLQRPDGEKYAELTRIRLGSRLLAYLPMRVDKELIDILKDVKQRGSMIGIKQFIIQTHFQTPLEVTPEALDSIRKILTAGWLITNQLVYNVAASRRGHTARLREVLNKAGVLCYYTFSVKGFNENYAVFAPISRSIQEQTEEKIWGELNDCQKTELDELLKENNEKGNLIATFLKKHDLPFLATDRNVLNLPAIGKSMTFQTVGITAEGKRIMLFDHDGSRKHSPIINQMGNVFIVENKSLAAYLRQLDTMGENIEEYATLWYYTKGTTEHFVETIGERIGTIHASDFDFVNECHWLPTQGDIKWGKLMHALEGVGYEGVFMYEATKDHESHDTRPTPERVVETFNKIINDYKTLK